MLREHGEQREYRVKTDEDFFKKFKELELRVQSMASLFQNNNAYVDEEDVENWLMDANKLSERVQELKKEGYYKLEKLF